MTPDSFDDAAPDDVESEVDESEVARLVQRYLDPNESVSEAELRDHLRKVISGTIIELDPEGAEISLVVERSSSENAEPIRQRYAVNRITDFDGDPVLDWTYLGPQK